MLTEPYNSFPESGNRILLSRRTAGRLVVAWGRYLGAMTVTVILELRFKPDEVAAGRELMGRALQDTRAFDGNVRTDVLVDDDDEAHWLIYEIWETIDHDEAYRRFRAGEGKLTQLPPLLAAPPVKTRYVTSDI
jgi:quinol monooxygenase YgiN